jgi:predicted RNA-binding Zn ribbon-like protein
MLPRWGRRLGLLGETAPPARTAELEAARELRAAVYAIFAAVARGDAPTAPHLETLASNHASAAAQAELGPAGEAWKLGWPPGEPAAIRFAVTLDALELLGDEERLRRVSRCPGRDCGWLFVNASGRRRWCAMGSCGSREKMRRLYERQRAGV